MDIIKPGRVYDFMGKRKFFLGLSFVLVAISVVSFFVPGIHWGTDFRGGTEIEVAFTRDVTPADVRDAVASITFLPPPNLLGM